MSSGIDPFQLSNQLVFNGRFSIDIVHGLQILNRKVYFIVLPRDLSFIKSRGDRGNFPYSRYFLLDPLKALNFLNDSPNCVAPPQ